jgi:hypothetical protein
VSTKLHLRGEGGGRPLVVLATPGQRHEVTQLAALLKAGAVKRSRPDGRPGRGQPRKRPATLVADKGYSFPSARRLLRRRGIRSVIPTKSDQRRKPSFDRAAYRGRNRVEIVCTQVTKPRVGAAGGGWDHVADLDLAVGDHDPVDQQLHQLAALLEVGLVKAHPELLQHRCRRLGDRAQLDQLLALGGDLPLARQQVCLLPGKGLVLPLEGGQVDHLGQVRLKQALALACHAGQHAA